MRRRLSTRHRPAPFPAAFPEPPTGSDYSLDNRERRAGCLELAGGSWPCTIAAGRLLAVSATRRRTIREVCYVYVMSVSGWSRVLEARRVSRTGARLRSALLPSRPARADCRAVPFRAGNDGAVRERRRWPAALASLALTPARGGEETVGRCG